MQITKDMLLSRKKEFTAQLEQHKANVAAVSGAIQALDMLLTMADAPEPLEVPKALITTPDSTSK